MREETIGNQRLICGDCLEVLPTLEAGSVDLLHLDPPYGEKQAEWDDEKPSEELWPEYARLMRPGGSVYYWGFWQHAGWVLCNAARVGLLPKSEIKWHFRTGRPQANNFRQDTETCWFFGNGEPTTFNSSVALEPYDDQANYRRYGRAGKHPGTVWVASRVLHNHPENVGHPTQKPQAIVEKIVAVSSGVGDTVLDPFLGSGTTLVAAELLGRRGIGIELSPEYFDIACRRVEKAVRDREQAEAQLTLTGS